MTWDVTGLMTVIHQTDDRHEGRHRWMTAPLIRQLPVGHRSCQACEGSATAGVEAASGCWHDAVLAHLAGWDYGKGLLADGRSAPPPAPPRAPADDKNHAVDPY